MITAKRPTNFLIICSRKKGITKGALKSKHAIENAVSLGSRPNVVPAGEANIRSAPRTVRIGWHPVGGVAGKWFAEQTRLGKLITEKIDRYPDPTQHWRFVPATDHG